MKVFDHDRRATCWLHRLISAENTLCDMEVGPVPGRYPSSRHDVDPDQPAVASKGDEETLKDSIAATRARVVEAYRWTVLYDYLPKVADPAVMTKVYQRVKDNRSLYQQMNRLVRSAVQTITGALPAGAIPGADGLDRLVAMPVEFAHAHSGWATPSCAMGIR
jgi:hypothetical protein